MAVSGKPNLNRWKDFRLEGLNEDFNSKFKKQANQDFDQVQQAKELVRKAMASSKKYSNSTYVKLKEIYLKLDDVEEYVFNHANSK